MKITTKYSLLLAAAVFIVQSMSAQDDRDFRIGFKVVPGLTWMKAKTNDVQGDGMGLAFSFGLMGDVRMADNYFFTPEFLVTSMTNRVRLRPDSVYTLEKDPTGRYKNISYKYSLKYIEIPLTFKFRTKESNGMRYWGQFGVAPGFIISNHATVLTTPDGSAKNFPTDERFIPNSAEEDRLDFVGFRDDISFLRASMILGAGIEINLSENTSFYSGLRFNNGFTDILREEKSRMSNNILGIEIGLFF